MLFRIDSKSYYDVLIPEQYRWNLDYDSAKPTFTIEVRDRGHIVFKTKPTPQAIILDIDVLEKISRIWCMVIPTLAGFPELIIPVNQVPTTLLPALEQIIQNCGHMSYYSLHDPLYHYLEEESDDNDTDDEILDNGPPTIVSRLENNYLKPIIGISKVKQYLVSEKNNTVEGPWLSQERNKAIIRFLAEVIRWTNAPHDRYNSEKFERGEMEANLPLLSDELKWFKLREKNRKKEEKLQGERVRRSRKKRGRGEEDGNTGKEENAEGERRPGGKRIRRGVIEV